MVQVSDDQKWPPHRAQRTQDMMYRLRGLIRGSTRNVEAELLRFEDDLGKDLKPVMGDALRSKAPEDGQNLLTYAAAQGSDAWFLNIAREIRSRLGIRALVKEIRELDIDRTPLLSNAAASRGRYSCFRTAHDLVLTVVGKGGLLEQLEAVDRHGRDILMHAARSNHLETFREVFEMQIKAAVQAAANDESGPLDVVGEVIGKVDVKGMNCLHHAAAAGCCEVLRDVMIKCQQAGPLLYRDMDMPDNRGRTPMMFVLRSPFCRGDEDACGNNDLKEKFDMLYGFMANGSKDIKLGWMEPTAVCSPEPGTTCTAVTELMHAARGGLASLELALNKARVDGRLTIDLDDALSVKVFGSDGVSSRMDTTTRTWGRALLLAAAAKRGDIDVLHHVLGAIQAGKFIAEGDSEELRLHRLRRGDDSPAEVPYGDDVKAAVAMISGHGQSVFAYTVLSGRTDAVELVYRLIVKLFGSQTDETWDILTGHNNKISPLACAASTSMETGNNGRDMFDLVYRLLKEQAKTPEELCEELVPRRSILGATKISPLVGAAFSSNWVLFWRVYDTYRQLTGRPWSHELVWPKYPPEHPTEKSQELHEYQKGIPEAIIRGEWTIPAVMWRDIVEALKRSTSDTSSTPLMSWRDYLKAYSRRAVKVASKRGAFTDLRDLTMEGFPLHDDHIAALLESIGDHEQDIIETVLFAVANASNPFGMAAGVSRILRRAEVDHPMYQRGLRRLQDSIDEFNKEHRWLPIDQLLDKLPHTVRGMGKDLLGGHQQILYGEGLEQGIVHRLGNLAGFIAAQWMLEPSLLVQKLNEKRGYEGPAYKDPLQSALDRGSKALDFLNSPLVLDYVHVKFTGTLPPWSSRNPFQPTVNEGFFKYDDFDTYELNDVLQGPTVEKAKPERLSHRSMGHPAPVESFESRENLESLPGRSLVKAKSKNFRGGSRKSPEQEIVLSLSFLLRFLQGWDYGNSTLVCNVPQRLWGKGATALDAREANPVAAASGSGGPNPKLKPSGWDVPHLTILPGLQFSLAGILGKPETFYQIPVIRFIFEILSYLVMLVLFCSSVLLKKHDVIPTDEIIFYVFAAGLLWREVLEFRDGMPSRRHRSSPNRVAEAGKDGPAPAPLSLPRISRIGAGSNFNRMVSAFTRYVFYDTWNFLDTSTICCILVAFIFRMIARGDDFFLFHAQFFYALSAPLLFSRLLVLSQIDATLGPMTQVIWRMMSHTLRFSAFIAMVMLSFALAFHAVFHTCGTYVDPDGCNRGESDDFPLRDAFGSFGDSFVTVFSSALGGPDFELFDDAGSDCRCNLPQGARSAGISLMVIYMVTMSVVLLNLLIAVLSTAHDEVYVNAEKEFHLARARLIVQSARSVARRRPPPPLNLLKVVSGVVVDTAMEAYRLLFRPQWATQLPPFSTTPEWKAAEGYLQRLAFAQTMGVVALLVFSVLWVLSVPWVAWCLLRAVRPSADGDDGDNSRHRKHWTFPFWKRKKTKRGDRNLGAEDSVARGYLRELESAVCVLGLLVVASLVAAMLCFSYIVGSFILWGSGHYRLLEWLQNNWGKESDDNTPEAMAGQESGKHWENAWTLANLRNHGIRENSKHPHFYVVPFLKSKTGLDMQHLARLTSSRDGKSKSEKELVEVDRELAHAPIDLEYLSWKAEKRREGKTGGSNAREGGTGGGYDDVESGKAEMDMMVEIANRLVAKKRAEIRTRCRGSSAPERGGEVKEVSCTSGEAAASHSNGVASDGVDLDGMGSVTDDVDVDEEMRRGNDEDDPVQYSAGQEVKSEISENTMINVGEESAIGGVGGGASRTRLTETRSTSAPPPQSDTSVLLPSPASKAPRSDVDTVAREHDAASPPENANDGEDTFSLPPPFRPDWLQPCGEIIPGVGGALHEGVPLSLHSVSRLCFGKSGADEILHLPADDTPGHGVLCQRWRDSHGHVEIKVAPQERKHVQEVRLLDKVYVEEISHRGGTGPCLIKRAIQGPRGSTFPAGTASISYFVGRYGLLAMTEGEQGGAKGMERYVRETYFPVVMAHGSKTGWEADGDFKVVWRGDEIWLETELLHFTLRSFAKDLKRFLPGRQRSSPTATTPGTPPPAPATPINPTTTVSLTPLGSGRYTPGTIEVCNATKEDLEYALIPETFRTEASAANARETNANLEAGGVVGAGAGHRAEHSSSSAQQRLRIYGGVRRNVVPPGDIVTPKISLQAEWRLVWLSVSDPIAPEDLPMKDMGSKNLVNKRLLNGHGYLISPGPDAMFLRKDNPSVEHPQLYVIRIWSDDTIESLHNTTISQAVLERRCRMDASVPALGDVNGKILEMLCAEAPQGSKAPHG